MTAPSVLDNADLPVFMTRASDHGTSDAADARKSLATSENDERDSETRTLPAVGDADPASSGGGEGEHSN
jgi:hypothetical protein